MWSEFIYNITLSSEFYLRFMVSLLVTTVYVEHDAIDGAIQILNSEIAKV